MKYRHWIVITVLVLLAALLSQGIAFAQTIEVSTNTATSITSNSAILNGNLTSLGNASSVTVWFQYATDDYYTSNGNTYSDSTSPQLTSSLGPFSSPISGLSANTTYHFRAEASDGNITANGIDATFTTEPLALGVTTGAATSVTTASATLNGTLTGLGNASSVNVWFQYATDTFYTGNGNTYNNSTAPQAMGSIGLFNSSISSLSANTTYHFRAVASDGNTTVTGSDATFATEAQALGVTSDAATSVTSSSATLNGTLTGMGNASSVTVWFQYATDDYYLANINTYSNSTAVQTMGTVGIFNSSVTSLLGDTVYHFRAAASDGNNTTYGNDITFATTQAPQVTTLEATDITATSAKVNGNLTSLGNSSSVNVWFEYTTDVFYSSNGNTYSNSTAPQAMVTTGTFSAAVSGLSGSTTYHFRAMAADGNTTISGSDEIFTTAIGLNLEGWGWCTDYNKVVAITFNGYTTMVARANAPNSYSMHAVGNLTLPAPYNETIPLDMYGNRARLLFYLRQEVTGKSVNFQGTWIVNASGNETYIGMSGSIALPNPQGEALKTAKICFAVLRTPDVDVTATPLGSFSQDVDSMLSRFIKFVDSSLTSLVGTGFAGILSAILEKLAVIVAHIRALGIPYIS